MNTPTLATAEQVSALREAADVLSPAGAKLVRIDEQMVLTGPMLHPLRGILLAAAEQIEANGNALGLPVSYPLEIAGVILGRDLGHNR